MHKKCVFDIGHCHTMRIRSGTGCAERLPLSTGLMASSTTSTTM